MNGLAAIGIQITSVADTKRSAVRSARVTSVLLMVEAAQPGRDEPPRPSAVDRLDSWKEIAAYLKRSVRTVHRWESEQGLPVHRHLHQSSGTVYAFKSGLDAWWGSRRIELEDIAESEDVPVNTANHSGSRAESSRRRIVLGVIAAIAFLAIAVAVVGKLTARQRAWLIGSPPVNPEVTELLYQGALAQSRQSYQGWRDAITYFERAIAIQPDLAQAYSAISICYLQFSFVGPLAPAEFMPQAEEAAGKAIDLDPRFAEPHVARAMVLYRYYWNWSEAESEFKQALDLNPEYSEGRRTYAEFLAAAGRPEEGLLQSQRARELDPRPVQTLLQSAAAFRAAGQYDEAVRRLREALGKSPESSRAHLQLGITDTYRGELNDAVTELETAVRLAQGPRLLAYLGYAYAMVGRSEDAQRVLSRLTQLSEQQYATPVGIAAVHLALGEKEQALVWLEKAYQAHDSDLTGIATDPRLRALESDPRFQDLLKRVGPPR